MVVLALATVDEKGKGFAPALDGSGALWALDGGLRVLRRDGAIVAPLSPLVYRLLERLARSAGHVVPHDALIDHLYADDRDGGPENATCCVRVNVMRLRRLGLNILNRSGHGYALLDRVEVGR